MPLYEWLCADCDLRFEALAEMTAARRRRRCPRCGRMAPRVISSFAISASGGNERQAAANPAPGEHPRPRIPPSARFCWMDDGAAERFAAYRSGHGTEYDDKQAKAAEFRQQNGEPAPRKQTARSHKPRSTARDKPSADMRNNSSP
ncbi:MAG: FmdB family zinc ribbon protein [Candidatus Binataceae bacterium]